MKPGQEIILSSKTKIDPHQDQKSLIKSKTLHELLKQGGGQNLVIDFSMLSKKGTLNGLIEKAKKYQNVNNKKIIEEPYDKKKENDEKNYKNSKKFEILTKFSQRKSKNIESDALIKNEYIDDNKKNKNNDINIEKQLINDLSNKINITTTDVDNMDETDNTYQGCLELEYDKSQSDFYSSREAPKPNKNYSYMDNDLNKKDKKVKFNVNDNNNNNNYCLSNSHRYQEKDHDQEQEQEQPILTKSFNYAYNIPDDIPQKKKPKNYIRRPFVIESKTNKNTYNKENTKFMKKSHNKKINNNLNQAIEYETIKENYSIKHCNCVLEYSFREDQNIDSGDEMSIYLQNNLAQIYKQNLLLNKGNIILSLKNAFHDADDEMRNQLNIEGLGSTGTLVHIKWESENDLMVYSANVGDSRVSLISPEHIIRLSYDHRTSDEKERKRILESGLEIIDDRINGTLMLTRIFGNYEYKNNIENEEDDNSNSNNYSNNKGLICEPFISKINIDLNIENQFLILASDGIWDTITEEEIQNIIQYHNDTQQICSIAIKNSLRNEAWDNLSIFAIKLT